MDKRYQLVWDFWTFDESTPCIKCWHPAVTLHEIRPRSRYSGWKENLLNSVPVCAECHELLQQDTIGWESYLQKRAVDRASVLRHWKGMSDEDFRNLRSSLSARTDDPIREPPGEERGGDGSEDDPGMERDS